jgi:hypothetical protein
MSADVTMTPASNTVGGAGASAAAAAAPGLNETMLAMDVVDTLRHADRLVERELSADQRAATLKQRLREIYKTQGIDVPEHILDEGVAALEQNRFVYQQTEPSFSRRLATIWVTRGRWGRRLGYTLLALVVLAGGWMFGIELPAERARVAAEQELSTGLPQALQAAVGRIQAATRDPGILAQADRLAAEGNAAARAGSLTDGRARLASLQQLQQRLSQAYTIRIVSRPGTPSGVWRVPSVNANTRNFYLIVEAVDGNGQPVKVPITSEEDGKTALTSQWGLRVGADTFNKVREDKLSNGVLQEPLVGTKQAGTLDIQWSIPTTGGAILQW